MLPDVERPENRMTTNCINCDVSCQCTLKCNNNCNLSALSLTKQKLTEESHYWEKLVYNAQLQCNAITLSVVLRLEVNHPGI